MRIALVALTVLTLLIAAQPARATTETVDGYAALMVVGCAVITGANLIAITLSDGSKGLGVAGVVMGSTLAAYAAISDRVDGGEAALIGIGVLTAAVGIQDIMDANAGHDRELLGMRVDPSVRSFDGKNWYGLQLTRSW